LDILSPDERSRRMSLIRSKNTKPEMRVRRLTHRLGYRYRLHDPLLPGCPDMVFKGKKKVIFVHGCFWHAHQGCPKHRLPHSNVEYWKAKVRMNQERDRCHLQMLWKLGWSALVIWECETSNVKQLEQKIITFLE